MIYILKLYNSVPALIEWECIDIIKKQCHSIKGDKMKKLSIIIMALVLTMSFAFARDNVALGLRGGSFSGISLRSLNSSGSGVEYLLTASNNGFKLAALFENHNNISNATGLTWFWGFGLHAGLSGTDFTTATVSAGLDAILGIEYSFLPQLNIPISLSLDYKPAFDIIGGWGTNWVGIAGTIRFTF